MGPAADSPEQRRRRRRGAPLSYYERAKLADQASARQEDVRTFADGTGCPGATPISAVVARTRPGGEAKSASHRCG